MLRNCPIIKNVFETIIVFVIIFAVVAVIILFLTGSETAAIVMGVLAVVGVIVAEIVSYAVGQHKEKQASTKPTINNSNAYISPSSDTNSSSNPSPIVATKPEEAPVKPCSQKEAFHPLVSEAKLRSYVPPITFSKAWDYYRRGNPEDVRFKDNVITAMVKGHNGNIYVTSASIRNGSLVGHSCDCKAHESRQGPCKHVIALVLTANTMGFKETKQSTKICPECGTSVAFSAETCPECGYPFKGE